MKLDNVYIPPEQIPGSNDVPTGKYIDPETSNEIVFNMNEVHSFSEVQDFIVPGVSCIILHDHTLPNSFKQTKKILNNIKKKAKEPEKMNCLLILLKIDRFVSTGNMEETFSQISKLANDYSCKFLPVTLTMNKTNLEACLKAILSNDRNNNNNNNSNLLESIFSLPQLLSYHNTNYWMDDNTHSLIEDFLCVKKGSEDWHDAYCVVKGEFFIQHTSSEIIVLFLTVCETKMVSKEEDEEQLSFEILTPNSIVYTFATNSIEKRIEWIDACKSYLLLKKKKERNFIDNIEISFSCILNIAYHIPCADCGSKGDSYYVSRHFGVYLCSECSKIHTIHLGHRLSKILAPQELHKFTSLWPALHEKTNEHFNLLWESNIIKKITSSCTIEERTEYIISKYKNKNFYSCLQEALYSPKNSNSLEWTRKYLFLTCQGEIIISSDPDKLHVDYNLYITWCSFSRGKDLGLSDEHFIITGPESKTIFRAETIDIAKKWLIILFSSQNRVKYTQPSAMNRLLALPRHRKKDNIPIEESAYSMLHVKSLLQEQSDLSDTITIREERELLKEKLEQKLRETLEEIKDLKEKENQSIKKISQLQTDTTKTGLANMSDLIHETDKRIASIPTGSTYYKLNSSGNLSLGKSSFGKTSVKRFQLLKIVENGIFLCTDEIRVRGATLNKLAEALVSPYYNEKEYKSILLNTYPSFSKSSELLISLCYVFALPIRDFNFNSVNYLLKSKFNQESNIFIKNTIDYVNITRSSILKFIHRWLNEFWDSDFDKSHHFVTLLLAFIDYIVERFPFHQIEAKELRNELSKKIHISLKIPSNVDTMEDGTIGNLSSLPRGGISSLEACVDMLSEADIGVVASQLCLVDHAMFTKIQVRELLDKAWTVVNKEELAPNVVLLTNRFNKLSQWVSTCIVQQVKRKKRTKIVEWFISLAQKCADYFDFHAVVAILGGIQDPSVSRMKITWEGVSPRFQNMFTELKNIIQLNDNWASYRRILASKISSKQGCVPYLGIYLKDLIFIEDGLPDNLLHEEFSNVINFEKRRKISIIMEEIKSLQQNIYSFARVGVVSACLELGLSMFPLLSGDERFEQSLVAEPRSVQKKIKN